MLHSEPANITKIDNVATKESEHHCKNVLLKKQQGEIPLYAGMQVQEVLTMLLDTRYDPIPGPNFKITPPPVHPERIHPDEPGSTPPTLCIQHGAGASIDKKHTTNVQTQKNHPMPSPDRQPKR